MIASPCTDICLIDPRSGFCFGCGRTGEEIGGWPSYDEAERLKVLAGLGERLAGLVPPARLERREARRARLAAGRDR